MSFRMLATLHAVWFLLLSLTTCFWRMSSDLAARTTVEAREQRLPFAQVRVRLLSLAGNVLLNQHPEMCPFVSAMISLKDDVALATPETLHGTESFTGPLMSAVEVLAAEYSRVRGILSLTTAADTDVNELVDKAKAIALIIRERDAAIRAAR